MGLGKTITCVALIAATRSSAKEFASIPLPEPRVPLPQRVSSEPDLRASHFAGAVWNMPETSNVSSVKGKAKEAKLQDRLETQYARACRIKLRSRATLIICPLSTVANWEEQFREHWNGDVAIMGGGGVCAPLQMAPSSETTSSLSRTDGSGSFIKVDRLSVPSLSPLRVYVYHGNARRPDPTFLADCDVVITTFSTLASEFSKQTRSIAAADDDEDVSSDSGGEDSSTKASKLKKPSKRRKIPTGAEATSPLQSVFWFRVVLDEAQ